MTLKASDLTPAQKGNLVRFVREHRAVTNGSGVGIRDKDFGSVAGLDHLIRKGAIYVLFEEIGPRGGKSRMLAPTPDGYRVADHITGHGLKTWR